MSRTVTDEWEHRLDQDGLHRLRAWLPFRRRVPAYAVYSASAAIVLLAAMFTFDASGPGANQSGSAALEAGLSRDRAGN